MTRWPLRTALAVVLGSNVVVLGGVAYNRSQAVERLELTETEVSYSVSGEDNSDLSLQLVWISEDYGVPFPRGLDADQLRAAGFALPPVPPPDKDVRAQEPRPAYAVLELGGERLRRWSEAYRAKQPPNNSGPTTRLMLIDVGRDPSALRAKYGDTSRYLISRCIVRASLEYSEPVRQRVWRGYVTELVPGDIHAPRELVRALRDIWASGGNAHYVVTLAYGRRYEPWIEGVAIR